MDLNRRIYQFEFRSRVRADARFRCETSGPAPEPDRGGKRTTTSGWSIVSDERSRSGVSIQRRFPSQTFLEVSRTFGATGLSSAMG